MSIITPNIDASPYTGVRNVKGKVRVKTHEDASWLLMMMNFEYVYMPNDMESGLFDIRDAIKA